MNKQHIEFFCEWIDAANKIKAIKSLRAATNCGLKEGKDAVEAIDNTRKKWRMSPSQFGLFMADYLSYETCNSFHITSVELITTDQDIVDWS